MAITDASTNATGQQDDEVGGTLGGGGRISADGRYVVFEGASGDLTDGDTSGRQDIFLQDLSTGAITCVSTAADGTQADGTSSGATISADGRYVAFLSDAGNLVPGGRAGQTDVYVKDLSTQAIVRINTAPDGVTPGNDSALNAVISADGSHIVFSSAATNLVADDANGREDVFVRNLGTGTLARVSADAGEAEATDTSGGSDLIDNAAIAADGPFVTISDSAANLVAGDTTGTPEVFAADTACYVVGTRIRTVRGDIAVEDLVVGDLAVTASGEPRPIRWLGQRTIPCQGRVDCLPVRIAAHAFGPDRPVRDLRVSPSHALRFDLVGELLIPAGSLVNGTTLTQDPVERVTYWRVELEDHDILLAENLPAESGFEVGNRASCRPRHVDGPLVDFVRRRLRERAEAAGWALVEATPGDLHLVADGVTIRPDMDGLTARFVLPAGAGDACLVSPTGVPVHVDAASTDRRRLGLVLTGLAVLDPLGGARDIALDDARLDVGFHPVEGEGAVIWRWTDGAALLPASLWADCPEPVHLQVTLAGTGVPRWVGPDAAPAPEPADLRHCA